MGTTLLALHSEDRRRKGGTFDQSADYAPAFQPSGEIGLKPNLPASSVLALPLLMASWKPWIWWVSPLESSLFVHQSGSFSTTTPTPTSPTKRKAFSDSLTRTRAVTVLKSPTRQVLSFWNRCVWNWTLHQVTLMWKAHIRAQNICLWVPEAMAAAPEVSK